ncbi:leucine-rich repeat extensin-like protein 5 isoform X1 [Arachis ipaensis]|uniref:leucine-rich repeat extensin-like protein 5 isoform X1 n=1 Tax=Arachis ipaensis TaxID=130454 RepID=UPI000A2B9012|nr:leucine-rich repeat extensin-like protein 5 isoform X1 [Arachis ipaensis]XP_025636975.1 leucine-rich repeat extensin-like protein 5 isoform X1 [Arachis hypogaea]
MHVLYSQHSYSCPFPHPCICTDSKTSPLSSSRRHTFPLLQCSLFPFQPPRPKNHQYHSLPPAATVTAINQTTTPLSPFFFLFSHFSLFLPPFLPPSTSPQQPQGHHNYQTITPYSSLSSTFPDRQPSPSASTQNPPRRRRATATLFPLLPFTAPNQPPATPTSSHLSVNPNPQPSYHCGPHLQPLMPSQNCNHHRPHCHISSSPLPSPPSKPRAAAASFPSFYSLSLTSEPPPRTTLVLHHRRAMATQSSSPLSTKPYLLFSEPPSRSFTSAEPTLLFLLFALPSPSASTSHRNLPFLAEPVSTSSLNHPAQPRHRQHHQDLHHPIPTHNHPLVSVSPFHCLRERVQGTTPVFISFLLRHCRCASATTRPPPLACRTAVVATLHTRAPTPLLHRLFTAWNGQNRVQPLCLPTLHLPLFHCCVSASVPSLLLLPAPLLDPPPLGRHLSTSIFPSLAPLSILYFCLCPGKYGLKK